MTSAPAEQRVQAGDGHVFTLLAAHAAAPRARLLWLPALGVAARHYLPFAETLAAEGVDVHLHEWRGNGSSTLRAGRGSDWGYRALLEQDLPASLDAIDAAATPLPLLIGGHSLGGQLACCLAGQHPRRFAALWLVASGTPYWRSFPAPLRYALPLVYRFLPWLARRQGVLHGRRLGFGGNEARGLIHDWARVGLLDRYAAQGMPQDLDADMAACHAPLRGVVLDADWMAPASSLRRLAARMGTSDVSITRLDAAALGTRADHFSWMKQPGAVARALLEDSDTAGSDAKKKFHKSD